MTTISKNELDTQGEQVNNLSGRCKIKTASRMNQMGEGEGWGNIEKIRRLVDKREEDVKFRTIGQLLKLLK